MVKTEADLDNLPPAERVKRLKELQERKREELKKEEEESRKLRLRKMEELRETQSRLERSVEELELEEGKAQEDERRDHDPSLEESLEEVPSQEPVPAPSLEGLMPSSLYELSDYNLYGELSRMEKKGYLTPDEQRRVADLQRQASSITDAYSQKDVSAHDRQRGNYLSRTEQVLKRLERRSHDLQDGLYDLDRRPDNDAVYQ